MTITRYLVVALLLGTGAAVGRSALAPVDVVNLIGKNRSEIAVVFPGTGSVIRDWRGWDTAVLVLSPHGQFIGLRLLPRAPIAEHEAEDAVRQLGLNVEPAKYFAGRDEHGYSDMDGPVRTVIYDLAADGRVTSVRIHSVLADTEQ
jgi:hypothetical protein